MPENQQMHDWLLISIDIDWGQGDVRVELRTWPNETREIVARGFTKVDIPRSQEWGESVSIMSHLGPLLAGANVHRLSILMQSGDTLELTAREIVMPVFEG